MTYDQAQNPRLGQRTGVESPGIRLLYLSDFPEVGYKGQLIYNATSDLLMVYDGAAWQAIGDYTGARTFVSTSDPDTVENGVAAGDFWYDPGSDLLQVWDGSGWIDPVLPPDSVGEAELQVDAITAKHVITSAKFQTADSGSRMIMENDLTGGTIKFWYNLEEVLHGFINPTSDGGRPAIHLSSGTRSALGAQTSAQMYISGSFAAGDDPSVKTNCAIRITRDGADETLYVEQFNDTVADPAMWTASGKLIQGVPSSKRYKKYIKTLPYSAKQLLKLEPKGYHYRVDADMGDQERAGFIAEEAHELGLEQWVSYKDGEPESFRYHEWGVALQQICREQQDEIDELKSTVSALVKRIKALEER